MVIPFQDENQTPRITKFAFHLADTRDAHMCSLGEQKSTFWRATF